MSMRRPVEIKDGVAYAQHFARIWFKGEHQGKTDFTLVIAFNHNSLPTGITAASVLTQDVIAFKSITWKSPLSCMLEIQLGVSLRDPSAFLKERGRRLVDEIERQWHIARIMKKV